MSDELSHLSLEQLLQHLNEEALSEQECLAIMESLPDKVSAMMDDGQLSEQQKGETLVSFQQALNRQQEKFEAQREEAKKALAKFNSAKKTLQNYQDIDAK